MGHSPGNDIEKSVYVHKTIDELQKAGWDVGVAWQDGRMFHGANAVRVNLALPFSRVKEAFERMEKYVFV